MSETDAFLLYLAIRYTYLGNYDFTALKGRLVGYDKHLERPDLKLIRFLMKTAKTNNEMLRLCVGNFLYGNRSFLYDESFTEMNYHRHLAYMRNSKVQFKDDLDVILLRCYNLGSYQEYLNSLNLFDDIFSCKIRLESLVMIYQAHPQFLPPVGYMSEDLVKRIKSSTHFIPLRDFNQNTLIEHDISDYLK